MSGIAASFSYLQHELASVEASYGYQAVYLRYTANKSHIFDSQTGVVEDRHIFSSDGFHSAGVVSYYVLQHFSDAAIVMVRITEQWFYIQIYYIHGNYLSSNYFLWGEHAFSA